MWNSWGYVYFSDGKYKEAIQAYENVINEPEVTSTHQKFSTFYFSSIKFSSRKLCKRNRVNSSMDGSG